MIKGLEMYISNPFLYALIGGQFVKIIGIKFSIVDEFITLDMSRKISFRNDYSEGAHPAILQLLMDTNMQQEPGYGADHISELAKQKIKSFLQNDQADIYFVSGGTQANLLVISHLLKPYESVIAADTGHIAVHETGAIENTGHKVNVVPNTLGKLNVAEVERILNTHQDHHMVKPGMVYISQSTEIGSIYSKKELQELYAYCQKKNLKLFIDGARLGVSLTADKNDLSLADLSKLCDVFYIGATKNGGLLGEAIVFNNPDLAIDFPYALKQKGALLAKGRLIGAQFLALFTDELFFQLAKRANQLAMRIAEALIQKGYEFACPPETNQLFPILPNHVIEALQTHFDFFVWEKLEDNKAVCRIVTSWATTDEAVDEFLKELNKN